MEILFLLLLILLNGLFAMSEIAIVTSRHARLQQRVDGGSAGALVALRLLDSPGPFLSTVQVGITTVGILAGAFGENAIAERLVVLFAAEPLLAPYARLLATTIMVVVVTYCAVVLGELVPKRLALINPERIAAIAAPPMRLLSRLAHPLVLLLDQSSNLLLKLLGAKPSEEPVVSEEEIRIMLQQGTAAGVFEASEQRMVGNVFRLDVLRVTAIMTPRRDLVFLDLDDSDETNRAKMLDARYQSMPLCRGGLDEVIGLLDAKHLLARALRDGSLSGLAEAALPPLFVPETVSAAKLLEVLKRRNSHVALVVDEYGGVEGLVTLTDVMEAIIGQLPGDRHADPDDAVQRADGSWLLDGQLSLERVEQLLRTAASLADGGHGYHTLGGFVMDRLGRVPHTGDCFDHLQWRFEVVDMDGNRVDRVLVAALPEAAVSDGG
jgi:putative hemolysin